MFLRSSTRPGRVSCEVAAPYMGLVHWSSMRKRIGQSVSACVGLHVWQSSGGGLKCLFWYIDNGFGVLDSRTITVHELQCLLNGWNASIKVPPSRPSAAPVSGFSP